MGRFGLGFGFGGSGRLSRNYSSVFDGGHLRLYSGSSAANAGDLLASGTLPGFPFNGADDAGVRTKRGTWSASVTINGTVRGLYLESVDGLSKAFFTVTESGSGGDVIIDDDALQIGNTVVISTMDWATSEVALYPNRPAGYTVATTEVDFSQAYPAMVVGSDRPIGSTGWVTFNGLDTDPFTLWVVTADGTAPQSPPSTWVGQWVAGVYSDGHGIGNVGTAAIFPTTRLYASMRLYYNFDASDWHPVSNKFVNIETDAGLILVQLREGSNWRHAEELGHFSVGPVAIPADGVIAGQLSNIAVPVRQWTQIEVLIDLLGQVFKVWQDGVLTTNAVAPPFTATVMNSFSINAHRGGGGETLAHSLYYDYDHFFLAK